MIPNYFLSKKCRLVCVFTFYRPTDRFRSSPRKNTTRTVISAKWFRVNHCPRRNCSGGGPKSVGRSIKISRPIQATFFREKKIGIMQIPSLSSELEGTYEPQPGGVPSSNSAAYNQLDEMPHVLERRGSWTKGGAHGYGHTGIVVYPGVGYTTLSGKKGGIPLRFRRHFTISLINSAWGIPLFKTLAITMVASSSNTLRNASNW